MKADLRPVDRTPCVGVVCVWGAESGSWFLAKAKNQEDNYREGNC